MNHYEELFGLVKRSMSSGSLVLLEASSLVVRDFVRCLAAEMPLPEGVLLYVLNAANGAERSFSILKAPPLTHLTVDGRMFIAPGRLTLPQETPIWLLVEGFESFSARDQRALAHLVDGEGGEYRLAKGSMVIAGVSPGQMARIEKGTINRARVFSLVEVGVARVLLLSGKRRFLNTQPARI